MPSQAAPAPLAYTRRQLPALRALSLRRCMYLKGGFLAALAQQLPGLQALDLSSCGLSLHLRR